MFHDQQNDVTKIVLKPGMARVENRRDRHG